MNEEPYKEEKIKKISKITYDGKQHLVRFPTKISNMLDLNKYKVEFIMNVPEKGEITEDDLSIKLVKK